MSEWWTYTLSDFLLFSPRVYYRLFELHNRAHSGPVVYRHRSHALDDGIG
jgi:hypothetical protein